MAQATPARFEAQPVVSGIVHNSENAKGDKLKNPIEHVYDRMFTAGFGRWVISMAVLGLAAGVISKKPIGGLRAAATYNVVIGCLHFFLPGPVATGRTATDPRPPVWYSVILAISTVAWASAFPLIFAFSNPDDDTYVVYEVSPDKDRRRGLLGLALSASQTTLAALENISLACGTMGACCFVFCLYQWYGVHQLSTRKWTQEELAGAWAVWEAEKAEAKRKEEEKKAKREAKKLQQAHAPQAEVV